MRVLFALCAQSATVDRSTNRVSIFNVIDHLPVSSFPLNVPSIAFVTAIESTEAENSNNINGVAEILEGEKIIFRVSVPILFTDNRVSRTVLNFQGVPVSGTGFLTFRLTLPDGTAATTSFQVINVVAQETAVEHSAPVSAAPSS